MSDSDEAGPAAGDCGDGGLTDLQELQKEIKTLEQQVEGAKEAETVGTACQRIYRYAKAHEAEDGFVAGGSAGSSPNPFHTTAPSRGTGGGTESDCCTIF